MIGVTVVPLTPVSIAGCDVLKPGPSPAVAGMATNVSSAAAPIASDANCAFLITLPLVACGGEFRGTRALSAGGSAAHEDRAGLSARGSLGASTDRAHAGR